MLNQKDVWYHLVSGNWNKDRLYAVETKKTHLWFLQDQSLRTSLPDPTSGPGLCKKFNGIDNQTKTSIAPFFLEVVKLQPVRDARTTFWASLTLWSSLYQLLLHSGRRYISVLASRVRLLTEHNRCIINRNKIGRHGDPGYWQVDPAVKKHFRQATVSSASATNNHYRITVGSAYAGSTTRPTVALLVDLSHVTDMQWCQRRISNIYLKRGYRLQCPCTIQP